MVKVPFRRLLLSASMILTSMLAASPSALAAVGTPQDPNFVNCVFASSAYWTQCWVPPNYSNYTQSEMRPLEIHNTTWGWHTHWHLQPAGQETTDYANFHIYFLGQVTLQSNPPIYAYEWRVYCKGTSGYDMCTQYNFNGPQDYGLLIRQPETACPYSTNKWTCASYAAAALKDCVTNTCAMGSWVASNFPGIGSAVMSNDVYGHSGNLQVAFCDVMNKGNVSCS